MTTRKRTKFQTCSRHGWLNGETRYRRAEFFTEGGPAHNAECHGGVCRLWPGTDIFEPSVCTSEFPLDWTRSAASKAYAQGLDDGRGHEPDEGDPFGTRDYVTGQLQRDARGERERSSRAYLLGYLRGFREGTA